MLSNAHFLAKFRFDKAENEPGKNLQNLLIFPILLTLTLASRSPGPAGAPAGGAGVVRHPAEPPPPNTADRVPARRSWHLAVFLFPSRRQKKEIAVYRFELPVTVHDWPARLIIAKRIRVNRISVSLDPNI